jgi:hypothetical protein
MWLPSVDRLFDVALNALADASLTKVLIVVAVVWTFVMVRALRV